MTDAENNSGGPYQVPIEERSWRWAIGQVRDKLERLEENCSLLDRRCIKFADRHECDQKVLKKQGDQIEAAHHLLNQAGVSPGALPDRISRLIKIFNSSNNLLRVCNEEFGKQQTPEQDRLIVCLRRLNNRGLVSPLTREDETDLGDCVTRGWAEEIKTENGRFFRITKIGEQAFAQLDETA